MKGALVQQHVPTGYRDEEWSSGPARSSAGVQQHGRDTADRPRGERRGRSTSPPRLSSAHRYRLYVPDFGAIFADRAVGGKPAHARDVEDGHAHPSLRIRVSVLDAPLAVDVRPVIGQCEILVAVHDRTDD